MKGVIYIWMTVLIGLFVLGFVYMYFTDTYYNTIKPMVVLGVQNTTYNTTNPMAVLHAIDVAWYWAPLILLFGMFLWAIVSSQKQEYNQMTTGW